MESLWGSDFTLPSTQETAKKVLGNYVILSCPSCRLMIINREAAVMVTSLNRFTGFNCSRLLVYDALGSSSGSV